ncbi:MAG TPA: hypothetical protein VGF45_05235, partial [Polyangia bacterium]
MSPLASIEHQIQRPNMLILLDTSGSMYQTPGGEDLDQQELGYDCQDSDDFCRVIGLKGRCLLTSAGKLGAGVSQDHTECASDADCTTGYCKMHAPRGCRNDADCTQPAGNTCVDRLCVLPPPIMGPPKMCSSSSDCAPGEPCSVLPFNQCVLDNQTRATAKMCRLNQTLCLDDRQCQAIPGDSCGPAISRMMVAKRVLSRVVQEFRDTVNFGLMTFAQGGYFPYFEAKSPITTTIKTSFLSRAMLETASPPCFSAQTGPAETCLLNGVNYSLRAGNNSRYRLNVGGSFATRDHSWGASAGCGLQCGIAGVGTGIYEGSHYTFPYETAAWSQPPTIFDDYVGRTRTLAGKTYVYWNAVTELGNRNNIFNWGGYQPFTGAVPCQGLWDDKRWPFMDTSKELPQA